MSVISFVFSTLLPIYATLALGAILRSTGFLSKEFAKGLNALVFWIALPCLIVNSISGAKLSSEWLGVTLVLVCSTLAVAVLSWLLACPLGISKFSRPSFCQSIFRSNNAYVGLPVILFALKDLPFAAEGEALAAITLAPCLILYNFMAVVLLTRTDSSAKPLQRYLKVVKGIFKNPLILACIIGVLLLALRVQFDFKMPAPIQKTMGLMANMATPGSLIALGASLTLETMRKSTKNAHIVCVFKLAVCPLLGVLFANLLGLTPLARFIIVALLACPCAVASFIMAQQMKGDADLAGSSVALSTCYSVFSLSLVLIYLLPRVA